MKNVIIQALVCFSIALISLPAMAGELRCISYDRYQGTAWWGQGHDKQVAYQKAYRACAMHAYKTYHCKVVKCNKLYYDDYYSRYDRNYFYYNRHNF